MIRHIVMLLSNVFRPDPRVLKEAESLAGLGYKITIVCWDRTSEMKPEETLESGVHILRVQKVASSYGIGLRQLMHLPCFWLATLPILKHLRPDLVHCHDFDTLPAGLLWGKVSHRPVIYDAHEYYARLCQPRLQGIVGTRLYRWIDRAERLGARFASAVVTVDERLGGVYRHVNRHVAIIGHYPNRMFAMERNPIFSRSYLTLVYIGRLSADRGLFVYAELLRSLRQQGIPAKLRLVGVFTSPEEELRLRDQAKDLEDALEFMGWVPYKQVFDVLRQADIGLTLLQPEPRYAAAIPVKLFEYMAAGLAVLASNFDPIAEVFRDVSCGTMIDPLNKDEAVNQVRYWWEHPDEARLAGEKGRQAVLQKYNWETLIGPLASLYRSLEH